MKLYCVFKCHVDLEKHDCLEAIRVRPEPAVQYIRNRVKDGRLDYYVGEKGRRFWRQGLVEKWQHSGCKILYALMDRDTGFLWIVEEWQSCGTANNGNPNLQQPLVFLKREE